MTAPAAETAHPFPQHVTYAAGSIRPGRRPQAQLGDDVRTFHDSWKSGFLEGERDGDYCYNAGRVRWRLGVDALLNSDVISATQARKISEWALNASGGDPRKLRGG
jgi:hypothetical protein